MSGYGTGRHDDELEARLRDGRPEPAPDLLSAVEARLVASSVAPRAPGWRTASLAVAFAACVAAVFGVVGGFGVLAGSNDAARVTVAVPAKAVPTLLALQEKGAVIADTTTKRSATKAGLTTLKGIKLQPVAAPVGDALSKSHEAAEARPEVRNLVPFVARNTEVVRFPATDVYLPGPHFPVCYPIPGPPGTTYWVTIFVPTYAGFVPPGIPGIC